ncbi:MAG TPA: hypothetical protein VKB31_06580 [Trueperaceae bacterium]|nr:hypothetical protein [Trueperaceae bacterium]
MADGHGRDPAGMDAMMRRVSRLLSGFALALMALGLALAIAHGNAASGPLSLGLTLRSHRLMLFGVGTLAVLPGVRVLVAMSYYTAARRLAEALVALVVVLELIASMITGG